LIFNNKRNGILGQLTNYTHPYAVMGKEEIRIALLNWEMQLDFFRPPKNFEERESRK